VEQHADVVQHLRGSIVPVQAHGAVGWMASPRRADGSQLAGTTPHRGDRPRRRGRLASRQPACQVSSGRIPPRPASRARSLRWAAHRTRLRSASSCSLSRKFHARCPLFGACRG
jgi:hypothetical protein